MTGMDISRRRSPRVPNATTRWRRQASLALAGALTFLVGVTPVLAAPAPQSPTALTAQSRAYLRAYDYPAALRAAEQAVALAPFNIEANAALRLAHSRLGTANTLASRYRSLLQQYPDSAAANYLLSTATNDYRLSEAYLREALRLDPTFGPAVRRMAQRTSRNSNEGLEWGRKAMELMPGDYSAASAYVGALLARDRDQEAINLLKQMTAQYPQELRYWTQLWSTQLRAMGRTRRVGSWLAEINVQRYRFMGSMEDMELLASIVSRGGPDGAVMSADLWVEIAHRYPDHPRAEYALLRAVTVTPDIDAKVKILDEMLELYPGSPALYRTYERIVQALTREERFDQAIELSKSLLQLPDPGFQQVGVGRDSLVRRSEWGLSLECIGHVGWFTAAQSRVGRVYGSTVIGAGGVILRPVGSRYLQELERVVPSINPEAAAAGQSLAASGCREPTALITVSWVLAANPSYRALGIQLVELSVSSQADRSARNDAEIDLAERLQLDASRSMLAALYLKAGRLDDAVRLADRLAKQPDRSMLQQVTEATIAAIFEAGGRPDDAKAHYLRAGSRGRAGQEAQAQLARLYRQTSTPELERFPPNGGPQIAVRAIQLRPPNLDVRAHLGRFLSKDLTLVYVWSPDFAPSRSHLDSLAALAETFVDTAAATLSIGVTRSAAGAARALERDPVDGPAALGALAELAKLSVTELPTTLLIDDTGRVLARQMSFQIDPAVWLEQWSEVVEQELERLRPASKRP